MVEATVAIPNNDYVELLASHSADHWWYEARRALVRELLKGRLPVGQCAALDAGCGTAEVVELLADLGASTVVGTDVSARILGHAAGRLSKGSLLASDAERLPFRDRSIDLLTSLEVLEHLADDGAALAEYHRVMQPGATLLVTVPSYQSLWCKLDVHAGHHRRYRQHQLLALLDRSGFTVERSSYYFSFLVPPAYAQRRTPLVRLMDDFGEDATSGVVVDATLRRLSTAERAYLRTGRSLPFGLSMFALATRT